MNTQLRYYTSKQINPVEIPLGGKKWSNHFEQRLNLLERHLKLPASWFKGKRVLEFGPNKGENSLIFAKKISGIAILSQSDGRAGLVTWEPFKASVWVLTAVKRWPTLRKPPSTYRPPTGRQHARQRNRSTTLADAAVKPCSG